MLTEEIIQRILTKIMVPEQRYRVKELENLLAQHYDFSEQDNEIIGSENRERWRVLVKNSVRRSPMRTDFATNSWIELWVDRPNKGVFEYYISPSNVIQAVQLQRPKKTSWWSAEQAVFDNLLARGFQVEFLGQSRGLLDFQCSEPDGRQVLVVVMTKEHGNVVLTEKEYTTLDGSSSVVILAVMEAFDPQTAEVLMVDYIQMNRYLQWESGVDDTFTLNL
jgi:hypothetical protein